ncbi:hypothetical protein GJ744_000265 [Endocarpon pusillum]|uniref:ZZ-type domain-containing protein n=1 Tax=Endocarpon pusillum TaxID=364733 RepID=A0A8H7E915_9EURO|nr:hypothetical protein GJ744_000265 [Endocarpon pusillum]
MATQAPQSAPVGPDTLITVKVSIDGTNRRFKLALRDLGAHVLPQKLRFLLSIPPDTDVVFERFSDSAGSYVALDSNNPAIYKQLYRAAKAKLKLRIKTTIVLRPSLTEPVPNLMDEQQPHSNSLRLHTPKTLPASRHSYLETVLSTPRDEESQSRHYETSTIPDIPSSIPAATSATMSLGNATNDTLVTPAELDQAKAAKNETSSKMTLLRHSDLGRGSDLLTSAFCIDCNNCKKSIPDEHYHCGICDDGDFDLCSSCVAADVTCDGEGHWLIKRRIQGGILVSSVTETIAPKKWQDPKVLENEKQDTHATQYAARTCNSCIDGVPCEELVTCTNCADYDLCMTCFSLGEHGHHPAHRFEPVSADASKISSRILSLCEAGRGLVHAAICDGCDKHIIGVRHKCLSCPDWDYCSTCVLSAPQIHTGHRFAALYEPIAEVCTHEEVHFGIYCDGPLCSSKPRKQYIRGTRYKCAVCNDTDFCANCEAIPSLRHNRTHPLIKFKTPVRHVSVTTLGEKNNGQSMGQMGDRPSARNAATETTPVANSVSTATQVQTVAEVKPVEMVVPEKSTEGDVSKKADSDLQAWFECDSTPDGSKLTPNRLFTQSWTIRNPGPDSWPAGCAVYFTGGDHMLNVDTKNPSSVTAMAIATKSNFMENTVEPGQTAVFTVLLKSPERQGRAISYWRLKTLDGTPFGHKLWVDITVAAVPLDLLTPKKAEAVETAKEALKNVEVKGEELKKKEASTMIFPKLDKESPVSSVHGLPTAVAAVEVKAEDEELAEDLESLHFEDEDESDDGFMTDEEYDILDASDEDLLMEAQSAAQK